MQMNTTLNKQGNFTSAKNRRIKILVADDHCVVRDGIRWVIQNNFEDAEIIEAVDGDGVLKAVKENPDLDIIMLDYYMPGYHGIKLFTKIKNRLPKIPVIFISSTEEYELMKATIDMGACGFIPKSTSPQIIVQAINLVLAGGAYIPKSLLQPVPQENSSDEEFSPCLTNRQLEILSLMAKGISYKNIAEKLEVSHHTVKSHATCLRNLLSARNRATVIDNARKLGLIK